MTVLEGLLVLIIVSFPVNRVLFANLRAVDLLILVFIVFALPSMRFRLSANFLLALCFLGLYCISTLYGLLAKEVVTQANLLFFFKYLLVFLLIWVLSNIHLSPAAIRRISTVLFVIFLMLVLYSFYHVLRWTRGAVSNGPRVSFPFTSGTGSTSGDPHLFAVVLSTCLVGFLFYPHAESAWRDILGIGLILVTVVAIVLSGSRMGLFSIPVTLAVFLAQKSASSLVRSPLRVRWRHVLILACFVALLVPALIRVLHLDNEVFTRLTSRVLGFDPQRDASLGSRIEKAVYAMQAVFDGPILIGVGMQSARFSWFDVGYASALYSTGLVGLVIALASMVVFLRQQRNVAQRHGTMQAYRALELLFVNFCVCALGSEFYLVTRGLVPFAVFTGLYVQMIRQGAAGEESAREPLRGVP